ncbi:ribosome hibernation-promoting factor, HPF/YfiA family [Actinokineospora globicatena]|uniref:ribosome hibernation-promoting factor, HPF/YfiA family n=1 Tax=Actinokineospora globicatena TaxID=103729 RepID=UPI0020A3E9EC|nr:ribosome-associated translation inhibitor RaiA [Actinokineospora globicatena]MCP2302122.1 SSU ribosomal protein S30P /sigma 54 modulation protein [Actinokineospora globicatena]GLW76216.1 ribosomal subunit interface protein [Actinokineospora globicatena]GLW83052.1 ribosomal subunit interface protein [Actinokineospora globicatena]
MDIVVKGRNVEVPEHYRTHVEEKLTRLERYDRKVIRFDVELFHEPNRRQSKSCQRVEITGKGKGPAVRAEAVAGDFYAALDLAVSKIENRLRRQHDRRRVHHGRRTPTSVGQAVAAATPITNGNGSGLHAGSTTLLQAPEYDGATNGSHLAADLEAEYGGVPMPRRRWEDDEDSLPGRVVREKEHPAKPMTVDQALYEMELVGHDFYLFADADTGTPSVVYRRHAFDYGVIKLV